MRDIPHSANTCWFLQHTNGPVVGSRKRPSQGNYEKEKEHCITLFDQWSEADQVEFVERLISRMCHYQHGHINSYLKPMLQRDFITALPGKYANQSILLHLKDIPHCFSFLLFSPRLGPYSREHLVFPGRAVLMLSRAGV